MVARLEMPQPSVKLTQANHPENAGMAEKRPAMSLPSTIGICALTGLLGMTIGSAAFSTAFGTDNPGTVLYMIPLVTGLVALLGGWVGAFFYMCREEADKKE